MNDLLDSTAPVGAPESDPVAVRDKLMRNRVLDDVLASALGIGMRQMYHYAERGMPYIRIGGRRYFDLDEVREWLSRRKEHLRKEEPLPPPRPVGRPPKSLSR